MVRDSRQYESWGVRNIDIDRNRPIIILVDHDEREKGEFRALKSVETMKEKKDFRVGLPASLFVGQIEQRLCRFHSYLQGAEHMLVPRQGREAIVGREKNNQTGDQTLRKAYVVNFTKAKTPQKTPQVVVIKLW